ncbi:MAG: glycosyltransferase family 2 protein [Candidatus Omnitrophica bacterium]|nr:glycosyltransferase family 2 protein [Candidatus Omnitrophota bacterium]
MRLLIIVPAYNEEKTIAALLGRIAGVDLSCLGVSGEVVVVDDGSTDRTADIVRREFPQVNLLCSGTRRGKGAAVLSALKGSTADIMIVQDADLEYDPADYPRLLEPVVTGKAQVVYGSRFLRSRYPVKMLFMNYLGNLCGTTAVNLLYGARLTDLMTCYKVVPVELMKELGVEAKGFDICPELTAKLLKRRVAICEVPIAYKGRSKREGKKIVFRDSLYILRALLQCRLRN